METVGAYPWGTDQELTFFSKVALAYNSELMFATVARPAPLYMPAALRPLDSRKTMP